MNKKVNEHYLEKELYELMKTDSTLFDFIQEGSLDGMWYWNLEKLDDEWLSPKFWEVLGYDPKEKKHSSSEWQDIIFKDDLKEAINNFEKHLQDPKYPYDQVVRYRHKNGSTVWIRCRGIAIRDANGKAIRMLGAHTNITDLKQIEQTLIESEKGFRSLFENAPFGYQSLDDSGHIIVVNERWLDIMGYQKEEVIGKWFGDFLTPDMKEHFKKRFEFFKERGFIHSEFSMNTKDGNVILVGFDGNVSYDENHEVIQTHCTVTDITEISIANKKLKQSEELFHKMLDVIPDMVSVQDSDMNILYSNWNGFANIPEERRIIPSKCYKTYRGLDDICSDCQAGKVLKSKKPIRIEAQIDENRWLDVRGIPILDKNGNVEFFVEWVRDISERVSLEKQRAKEYKDLLISQKMAKLGTWRLDIKTNNVVWSEELYKVYGLDPALPPPPYTEHMKLFTKSSWEKLSSSLALTASEGIPYEQELKTINRDGSNGWLWVRGEAEYDDQGHIVSISGAAQDITEKKIREEENIYVANHDYLTNLYNRRYFVNAYGDFILQDCFPIGLIMIDINGLKIINDAYGHVRGDEAIKRVSRLLMDVFDQDDVVARIGGDEFAILVHCKNALQLQTQKDELIARSMDIEVGNIPVSLAIGYAMQTGADGNIDELLNHAEKHLYRHKVTVGESVRNHAIKAILNTLTDKYENEKIHSEHVSMLCKKIGTELGLDQEDVDILELAGMYHDIGKISIPDAILNKPGKLSDEEYDIIKTHTQIGYQILRAADEYSGLAEYALSHHERWDGKGYPKGLKGNDIPLFSRIINVADSFEAMTSDRPYRKGLSIDDAIAEIKRCSGTQFDPEIANLFLEKVLNHVHK